MRVNKAEKKVLLYTHEGAVAVYSSQIEQLRRSVMANMLFEDEFYEDGESIAKRIEGLVGQVVLTKDGPQTIADIAHEARTKMKLRHVPLLLVVSLIRARTEASRAVVADTILRVVQRPDEMGELVALYWKGNQKSDKKMLPAQMKKGLAAAFQKFDEYALAKYDGDAAVKLRDVLFYSHAKPKSGDQAELWKRVASRTLKTPDTWEVALSGGANKKEAFTRMLQDGTLGALALLRNLRNMIGAGVDEALIRTGLGSMKTERVLPFRFITAAKYAPTMEPELEAAMFRCLEAVPKLPGKTVLVVDNSGSMHCSVSMKSELQCVDAACALAMLLREICESVQIVVFGSTAGMVPARRGFALRDLIVKSEHNGGTDTATALNLAAKQNYDRCIVITDEQSHTTIGEPLKGTKAYFVNVASAQNGIGYRKWVHIDGWSEAIVDYIQQYEALTEELVPA